MVRDEIKALEHQTSVRWGMVTRAEVELDTERTAVLRQDGEQFFLTVLSPVGARLEVFPTETPPRPYDASNPGTCMIGFKVALPPSEKVTFLVLLSPEKRTGEPPGLPSFGNTLPSVGVLH